MEYFKSMEEYELAVKCHQCGALPGSPCDRRDGKTRSHVRRQDAGAARYSRDVGNAPWPEDRIPGHNYSSI